MVDLASLDAVDLSHWECTATPPGAIEQPGDLEQGWLRWWPAQVPGTAAGALREAGFDDLPARHFDQEDWWFRCRFSAAPGTWHLQMDGLATVADVWLNGTVVAHSENMFVPLRQKVELEASQHELVIRFAALEPLLAARRPRPRWKTYMVSHQNLRWFRTSLLGRVPGWAQVPVPVGPWRPVRLVRPGNPTHVVLRSRCEDDDGVVEVSFELPGRADPPRRAVVQVEGSEAPLRITTRGADTVLAGQVLVPQVRRWWPHTHGDQPLYEVRAVVDDQVVPLGRTGFRTVSLVRQDGRFCLAVNDTPVFCRGAAWFPPDPVRLHSDQRLLAESVALARRSHMNMLRVPGTTAYADHRFLEHCDEAGILVWHDCMFAFVDPPEDPDFHAAVATEVDEAFATMAGHPAMAVVCGSQEVEEIAAMNGLDPRRYDSSVFDKVIPGALERLLPDVPYVTSNPTGGPQPFVMDEGVSQYFGVGGYLRPLEDIRRAGVRFAAECLVLATPPERQSVARLPGEASGAGHDPRWKAGVHHDAGRSWDMDDVRDFYSRELFGIDPLHERYVDPERALDIGRATNAHLVTSVFSEWRRLQSTCDGGLVVALRDLAAGAGWGLADAQGIPKAPWFAARRAFAPVTLVLTDEGLNGLRCHLLNDTARPFNAALCVELFARGEVLVESGRQVVDIPARGGLEVEAGSLLEGFRDITYAYRFAPPGHDVVAVSLQGPQGELYAQEVHLPLGQHRPLEPDVGLVGRACPAGDGTWTLQVSTRRFAQWVSVDVGGFVPEDSWFHLPPGATRSLRLFPRGPGTDPRGRLRALNSQVAAVVSRREGS